MSTLLGNGGSKKRKRDGEGLNGATKKTKTNVGAGGLKKGEESSAGSSGEQATHVNKCSIF